MSLQGQGNCNLSPSQKSDCPDLSADFFASSKFFGNEVGNHLNGKQSGLRNNFKVSFHDDNGCDYEK